jgi:subunit length determinant Wzz-like protein
VSETIELDLSLRALWRWKWLVLVGAIAAAAIAAGIMAAAAPRYTTTALVEVGRVMGEELEDAFAVAQTINSQGFQEAVRKGGRFSGSVSAEALTGGQGRLEHPTLVRVTVTAPTADGAVALGQATVDELVARHKERFDAAVAGYREYEKVLASTGEPAAGTADPATRKELYDLRARLASPVFTEPTHVKDPFPVPSAPEPKNVALAAGVAFAVSLAILVLLVVALAQVGAPRT